MTYDPNGEFDTLLSDGLRRRAAAAGRPSHGFSDVRRRYRRRRQQQVALGLVPAVAGLGWLVTRPRTDQPLQPSGGGLVDCGDATVPTYPDTTMVLLETTTWGPTSTSTTIVEMDANGFPLNTLPSTTAPPPWTGATSTVAYPVGTTTTIVPADFPVLILNASHSGTAEELVALKYPGIRTATATSTVAHSVVLMRDSPNELASTIARDLGIDSKAILFDTSLVPAGTDLSGINVIVILGDDAPSPVSTTIPSITPTTVCEQVPPTTWTDTAPVTTEFDFSDFSSTKVQVANCSAQNGVAQMMSQMLTDAGFTTVDPVNGMCDPKLESTYVIYDEGTPGAQAVAQTVAAMLGGVNVETAVLPIKTESGEWAEGSGVVVLLGNDLAGKTLDQITMPTTTMAFATTTTSISG